MGQETALVPVSRLPAPIPNVCWEGVGKVLGRRAGVKKGITARLTREMLGLSLAQMGALVGHMMSHKPYHRTTVWHWECPTNDRHIMPDAVVAAYHQIIRDAARTASAGRYVARVQNKRSWRVTLVRVR